MASGLVGSKAGLDSGLVWLESVGNKWTEQGLFPPGFPPPHHPLGLAASVLPRPWGLGDIAHSPSPGLCFRLGS